VPSHATRVVLLVLAVAAAIVAALLPALPQDPTYHAFADARPLGPIPNAANVLSNLVFVLVGFAGLRGALRNPTLPARPAWLVTFTGIALVSLESACYHLAPGNGTLVWDRLPMTIGFMGLLCAVLAIPFGERTARALLWPAVAAGAGSVVWWDVTGDLRPYVWVQFTPLLLIAATLALCPMSREHRSALLIALALYLLAKGFEMADRSIFTATAGMVGGHALKHLSAGAACAALVRLTR
jgi:hypothetical protein